MAGFPSNDRFALCLLSKEHMAMNSWENAPWRGGRAGGYSRRPLEGDPVKGSSSKSVRGAPYIKNVETLSIMMRNEKDSLGTLIKLPAGERPFLALAELVPLPDHDLGNFEKFLKDYAKKKNDLPEDFRLAAITIPQSPNGVASISPADIFSLLQMKNLWADLDVIPHVTAKDHNTEAIKTYLIGLQKLGIKSVLALTGDKPCSGQGVFEVDSLGLIELVQELNYDSFSRALPGHFDGVHQFSILAAVSPFKYTEASQMQQYFKMEKKIRSGADGLITQMGWDWRKSQELFWYLQEKKLQVPIFGNVYFLSTATPAPRLMFEGKLPGCSLTKELYEKVCQESLADHIERAAQQVAMYRDLGAVGVDIGGLLDFDMLVTILDRANSIGRDWGRFQANLEFGIRTLPDGRPGFYLYDESGQRKIPARPKASLNKKTFDILHSTLMTPGRGLDPLLKTALRSSRSARQGKGVLYKMFFAWEKALKTLLFDCEECGDCFLVENFGLCTLGKCEKGLPNPPCGDAAPDGSCPHHAERRCIGELIYDAAASEGLPGLKKLETAINPSRNPALEGTASVLNYLFEKDHAKKMGLTLIGENLHASIARPAAAMKELLAMGPEAFVRPSGPLDYIISVIQAQVKHGAAYIDVNVDAFGDSNLELRMNMMRDYVRLIRKHSRGVPVCVDSGSPDVLKAGLEEWYKGASFAIATPLLNSIKTYTMDEILPLRSRYPFKFIGLLVDIQTTGSEGSYYGVGELYDMAQRIFRPATEKYGFQPQDIFFDSTVFPLSIDIPMTHDAPGYTYRTFETIRRIKCDPAMKDVHLSLGITNAVRDLPGRRTGVCRAYLAKAQEYGLDAAIVNVVHDYGKRPPAPELLEFVEAFARQDGSAESCQRVIRMMLRFCRASRKIPVAHPSP
jgi:5,10-methylenetetrahydrofolate reductase